MELKKCSANEAKLIIHDLEKKEMTTSALFRQLQEWASPKIIVDKTPAYALDIKALQKINEDFEQAFFIHLMRHPASMIHSFEKYHMDQVLFLKNHPYSTRQLAELIWLYSHQNIRTFLRDIPPEQQFQLNYEDLVRQPQNKMKDLCQKAGLSFDPKLLNPYNHLESKAINGIHKESRSMSDSNLLKFNRIDANKADDWKRLPIDISLSKPANQLAQQYGYEVPEPPKHIKNELVNATRSITNQPKVDSNDIAIIGMSVRIPGANNLHEFWLNLVNGTDVSQQVTDKDLIKAGLNPQLLEDPNYVARSLSLDHMDSFDSSFFG